MQGSAFRHRGFRVRRAALGAAVALVRPGSFPQPVRRLAQMALKLLMARLWSVRVLVCAEPVSLLVASMRWALSWSEREQPQTMGWWTQLVLVLM